MDRHHDALVISPTDLVAYSMCRHVSYLDRLAVQGLIERPERDDPMLELLRNRGLDHERTHLEDLKAQGLEIVDIDAISVVNADTGVATPAERWKRLQFRAAQTTRAMQRGAPVVYQATFLEEGNGIWQRGHADFLRRVERPSGLGEWGYEPEDTKLSASVSAGAVLQLCTYAEMVRAVQGAEVDEVHVVLGGDSRGSTVSVRLVEVSAYHRAVRSGFVEALAGEGESYPLPNDHCGVCRWSARCNAQWEADDHPTRVAFLTVEQSRRLEGSGIRTLTQLAESDGGLTVPGIGTATLRRLQEQAELQRRAITGAPPPWRCIEPVEAGRGLAALPVPDSGDLFYDIEGHPYAAAGGLEYLHGLEWVDGDSSCFEGWWAHDEVQERRTFERLIDMIVARRAEYPGMHVYHYAPYEVTAIKRMMGKYGTREDEVDDLLRGEVFVDLYRVVRQGVRVGVRSYSIKRLESLYMAPRQDEIGDGGSSVVAYEQWMQTRNNRILEAILEYNRDDVLSNRLLRDWLEERRAELVARGVDVPRPESRGAAIVHLDEELAALIDRLNKGRFTEVTE